MKPRESENETPDFSTKTIDLNCDVGESDGQRIVGNDQAIIPLVTSANIACGAHGGDPVHTAAAVGLAIEHDVQIGAHPSYPDREGFGRRVISISPAELQQSIEEQLTYLADIVKQQNKLLTSDQPQGDHRRPAAIAYVKPHGALYHQCCADRVIAGLLVTAVDKVLSTSTRPIAILGQSKTALEEITIANGLKFVSEAYADRRYQSDGKLLPRSEPNAVICNPETAAAQTLMIAEKNSATANSNQTIKVVAESICVHGDSPEALKSVIAIRNRLQENNIHLRSF